MKLFFISLLLTSLFVGCEKNSVQNNNLDKLHTLQEKFLKIDINDKNLDLDKYIKEIKEARKLYPLDDKLKMISIELNHRRAQEEH